MCKYKLKPHKIGFNKNKRAVWQDRKVVGKLIFLLLTFLSCNPFKTFIKKYIS